MEVPPGDSRRKDARDNRERILDVATSVLRQDPDATVDQIAVAAQMSRATIYRHFGSRDELIHEIRANIAALDHSGTQQLQPPGQLSSITPAVLDITEVLNKVPPHLLGDQIVAEAQRIADIRSVAVYLVDIDGTRLRRLAGSQEFPDELDLPLSVGPEIPREALPPLRASLAEHLPNSVVEPMMLRGRGLGVLVAVDAPERALSDLARQAAACIALAESYTDVFDATRRRRDISAASEIQQNLLPPRLAHISGGVLAGNVLPGYDIGGDWFDYVENPDGAWIAVADAAGRGTDAAAVGSVTLGAFRAKRRRHASLEETLCYMDQTVRDLSLPGAVSNVIISRWHGPTATYSWVACGDSAPFLVGANATVETLPGHLEESLGRGRPAGQRDITPNRHRLANDEMVILVSDGVLQRTHRDGGQLGPEILAQTVKSLPHLSAPSLVRALERAIVSASDDPLEDDATIVVFSPH